MPVRVLIKEQREKQATSSSAGPFFLLSLFTLDGLQFSFTISSPLFLHLTTATGYPARLPTTYLLVALRPPALSLRSVGTELDSLLFPTVFSRKSVPTIDSLSFTHYCCSRFAEKSDQRFIFAAYFQRRIHIPDLYPPSPACSSSPLAQCL